MSIIFAMIKEITWIRFSMSLLKMVTGNPTILIQNFKVIPKRLYRYFFENLF